jgi:hypothetical protein
MQILQEQISAIHGGSTPASMRVMVVANCIRSPSLAVNKTAINVARLSKDYAKNLNLVPFGAAAGLTHFIFSLLNFCIFNYY